MWRSTRKAYFPKCWTCDRVVRKMSQIFKAVLLFCCFTLRLWHTEFPSQINIEFCFGLTHFEFYCSRKLTNLKCVSTSRKRLSRAGRQTCFVFFWVATFRLPWLGYSDSVHVFMISFWLLTSSCLEVYFQFLSLALKTFLFLFSLFDCGRRKDHADPCLNIYISLSFSILVRSLYTSACLRWLINRKRPRAHTYAYHSEKNIPVV